MLVLNLEEDNLFQKNIIFTLIFWTYNIFLSMLGVTINTLAHFYDLVRIPVVIDIILLSKNSGETIRISIITNGDVTL